MYIPRPPEFKREPTPIFLNRLGRSVGAGIGWDGVPPAGSEGKNTPLDLGKGSSWAAICTKKQKSGIFYLTSGIL
jgi:hypothetical protein